MDKSFPICYNSYEFYESIGEDMPFSLLPRIRTEKLTDLTVQHLLDRKIRLLMLDFDNTIVPYTTSEPTPQMTQWLETMQASDITLCVVSNSRKDRVKTFCRQYGIPCITHAKKPFTRGIRQCLEKFSIAPDRCALAGDQIFTDTLGANFAGVSPILVKSIYNHNIWLKLRHIAELPFIFIGRKRRMEHEKY